MKKLITALLVGLSAMAVSVPAVAHQGDIDPYPLWSFNFGAKPSVGLSYTGAGAVWTSDNGADGANNKWNYYAGSPNPNGSMNVSDAQAFDATNAISGSISVSAPIANNVDARYFNGYISSDGSTPITITTDVYGFGLDTGHAYVYTEQGKPTAVLQGISGLSTAQYTKTYTWYEQTTGITYDVYEYFVWSDVDNSMSFTASGGQMNALQLTPIAPHPVPEPNTVALLGIGGLISLVMRKRAFFVGEA